MPKKEPATPEQVEEVKIRFLQKYETEPPEDDFHPDDLSRIRDNDIWVTQLLEAYDLDIEKTLLLLWENCAWRKSFGVHELTLASLNQEYLRDGQIYMHNKDKEGKPLLILVHKKHFKSQNSDDLLRIMVYWIERVHSEIYLEKVTIFMDMTDAGLSNMDLDYTKRIINLFETKYPTTPNYILVHELPFLLNAALKIIKTFMPAEAIEIMRITNKKNITEYIDEDNCLKAWGGKDDYVYTYSE